MLELSLDYDGAVAIRYARGTAGQADCPADIPVVLGEPEIISEEGDFAVISAGHIFTEAYELWKKLEDSGRKSALVNLRFVRPLNTERLLKALEGKKTVFTFEENVRAGGIGEMLALLIREAFPDTEVHIMALPDEFIPHGTVEELRKLCGLTAEAAWLKAFPAE